MHDLALAMPHVTVDQRTDDNPVYQVGGKSFIFFRNPRPDAINPETGERYRDVIVFWVASEGRDHTSATSSSATERHVTVSARSACRHRAAHRPIALTHGIDSVLM